MAAIWMYDASVYGNVSFRELKFLVQVSIIFFVKFGSDTRRCLRYLAFWGNENHFVFIGDVRIRNLYQSFVDHLQATGNTNKSVKALNSNADLEYTDHKLRLRVNYIHVEDVSKRMLDEFTHWRGEDDPPSAIIAGCMYSKFKDGNFSEEIMKAYTMNLTRLIKPIDDLSAKKAKVIWKLQDPVVEEMVLEGEWKNVLNDDIEKYNQVAMEALKFTDAHLWASSKHIAYGLMDEMVEGYKLGPLALRHDVQILLNMYCNDYMNYNDGTCCSSAEPYTTLQVVTYAVLGVW